VRALALLALVACTSSPPLPENDLTSPPPRAEDAQALAVEALEDVFGELGDPPPVLWFAGACLEYEDDPRCMGGMYFGEEIHVIRPSTDVPSRSALAHELIHWALHVAHGDSDADHLRADWGLVDPITRALRAEGL
jgi:hypothetical protein